jgi:predicted mannosyl-3-phosphoglycerate phosphatase (HAD superfamily)
VDIFALGLPLTKKVLREYLQHPERRKAVADAEAPELRETLENLAQELRDRRDYATLATFAASYDRYYAEIAGPLMRDLVAETGCRLMVREKYSSWAKYSSRVATTG